MAYKRKRSYSAPGSSKRAKFPRRRRIYRRPTRRRFTTRRRAGIRPAKASLSLPKTMILKNPAMADRLFTTFAWRTSGVMQSTGGAPTWRSYRLNGLGVVDLSASSPDEHYPRYVTKWVNPVSFRRYRVYATTVMVVLRGTNSTAESLGLFRQRGLIPGTEPLLDGLPTSSVQAFQAGELPDFSTRTLSGTDAGGGVSINTFKARYKMANCYGVKKGAIYSEEDYAGNLEEVSAGPPPLYIVAPPNGENQILHVGVVPHPSQPTDTVTVDYDVFFKFHAVLEDNHKDYAPHTGSFE